MGLARSVVRTGIANVPLFCATHRVLPAKSVVPGWCGLFSLSGFAASNPRHDADKSFSCRGAERNLGKDLEKGWLEEARESMSSRPQLDLLDDPHGPQVVRIKIDNRIDNTLQSGKNRDGMSNADRNTAPNSQLEARRRHLPALVRGRGLSELMRSS